ncbi:unnamed protein product, partial [Symbiodinium pilosum]
MSCGDNNSNYNIVIIVIIIIIIITIVIIIIIIIIVICLQIAGAGTFWAGDHDVGMSCSCWDDSKKDGQLLVMDMSTQQSVTRVVIRQGGNSDNWAVKSVRLHCHDTYDLPWNNPSMSNPIEIDISM